MSGFLINLKRKTNIEKCEYIKTRKVQHYKEKIKSEETAESNKIFANYAFNERLIITMNEEFKKIKIFKTWAKDMNRHFSKNVIQMSNKYMKKIARELAINECK